jgi:hypothetical protein
MDQTERDNETNKLAALDLAAKIYKVVTDKRFLEIAADPEVRHNILIKKYPNFAQAYPIILRFISRDLRYNAKAFRQFLNKLEKDPGKGMEGFIERQADYAKFLYIEDSKSRGRHIDRKKAQDIYNFEYANMMKWLKKIKQEERDAKNEFNEESKENLQKKKQELLEFINGESIDSNADSKEQRLNDDMGRLMYDLPLKNAELSFAERMDSRIDIEKLSRIELIELCAELHKFIFEKELMLSQARHDYIPQDFSQLDMLELSTEYRILIKTLQECEEKIVAAKKNAEAVAAITPPIVKIAPVEKYDEHNDWLSDTLVKRHK